MNIDDYAVKINKNINRIKESDSAGIIDITIKDYAIYNTFFAELQKKLSNNGNKKDNKINALNFLIMHSTFMFNGFINDLVINNYYSLKINIRVIIEFYFKLLFLLYSDEYVSKLYLDFNNIYLHNISQKFNNNLRLEDEDQKKLKKIYTETIKKYDLPSEIKEDYWIKKALEHNTGKQSKKSIKGIIEWLKDNKKIDDAIIVSYEDSCDYNHCGIGSLNYQQLIDLYDSQGKLYNIYQPEISDFNYIITNITAKYMDEYSEYKNQEVLDALLSNTDLIFKQGSDE